MSELQGYVERRRSSRVVVEGTALLWRDRRLVGRYGLADLSVTGCGLRDGPRSTVVGDECVLLLQVRGNAPIRLEARVVRRGGLEDPRCQVGFEFLEHPQATVDRIHDVVVEHLDRALPLARGRVLLAVADAPRRLWLADALRALGQRAVEAMTPLAAVWELENGPPDIHTAVIARTLGRSDGRDIVKFIFQRHRRVRRILLADQGERADLAHAVLSEPLDLPRLRDVLPRLLPEAAGRGQG